MPRRPAKPRRTSCGVLVSDGARLLLGHAARSVLWDIPKGVAEAGEGFAEAAVRELREETGLQVSAEDLTDLGVHGYLPGKDLAVFAWRVEAMPAVESLRCTSRIPVSGGGWVLEFDRFAVLPWDEALGRVGKNMARVLGTLRAAPGWPFGGHGQRHGSVPGGQPDR
ncbi:NUDIX hydrolase [Pararoseomonas indoligenes]|uniref:NUDIX hydrolase n=1 Tax=Roseomonas indoligenes TaxID=2820811 RepID=A0A940MT72_9PROT|nr:NUDIX hydrolase [Pararoseomonas indoligenes]MBP0491243.1 NUDIX hydrolase [Pararoseomonas indoligenes]